MKKGLFLRISLMGMKKNKRLYIPYIISGICMTATYYILSALSTSNTVYDMKGGRTASASMELGKYVILIFSVIFIFYVNSFLVKQRMKEFGLYNVLGMEKKNLIRILFWDSFLCGAISMILGMFTGVGLEKLSELILARIVRSEVGFSLYVSFEALSRAVIYYAVIYFLVFSVSCIKILRSDPISLLKSESVGEKQPRANWVLAILGILLLGGAYFLAIYIDSPSEAILLFFIAVLMVIAATLCIFTAGSVALCSFLKNRKRYYYKPNHFVSVSQMTYRMKRNGASLALICILATMVMVMLAGSGGLYFNVDRHYKIENGFDNCLILHYTDLEGFRADNEEKVIKACEQVFEENNIMPESTNNAYLYVMTGSLAGSSFYLDDETVNANTLSGTGNICRVKAMDVNDYNRLFGTEYSLSGNDMLVVKTSGEKVSFNENMLNIDGLCLKAVGTTDRFLETSVDEFTSFQKLKIVVSDLHVFDALIEKYVYGIPEDRYSNIEQKFYFGYNLEPGKAKNICDLVNRAGAEQGIRNNAGGYGYSAMSIEQEREEIFGLFGGLFFLGILLSVVFIIATVLVLFYKQIAEGYEDRKRFEIMRKVGMTKKEIKGSINSQMRTVFLLPLIMAVVHLAFSLPMIYTMLSAMEMASLPVILTVAGIAAGVFAIGYIAVYKLTSGSYFKIVTE